MTIAFGWRIFLAVCGVCLLSVRMRSDTGVEAAVGGLVFVLCIAGAVVLLLTAALGRLPW